MTADTSLREMLNDTGALLGLMLAQWDGRETAADQAAARRAASVAIDAIDSLTRQLFQLRARLVSEIRHSDDAAAARVDALLSAPPEAGQ